MRTKKVKKGGHLFSKNTIKCYRPKSRYDAERKFKFKLIGKDKKNYSLKDGKLDRNLRFIGAGSYSNICDINSSIYPDVKKIIRVSKKDNKISENDINNIYTQQNEMIKLQSEQLFSKITPKIYSNKISSNKSYTYSIIEKYHDLASLNVSLLQAPNLCKQIFFIVYNLHKKGIYHRDLKDDNMVYKQEGKNKKVAIIDFDLMKTKKDLKIGEDDILTGTPMYLPPLELFFYLPLNDDYIIKTEIRKYSQNLLLKLFDMYAIMVLMFGKNEGFEFLSDIEDYQKGSFNIKSLSNNISFLKKMKKLVKKTNLDKTFILKMCNMYINLIEIILDILEVGKTHRLKWLENINQQKVKDLEHQLDELYNIIGHEMYLLYGLPPPDELVNQEPISIDILLELNNEKVHKNVKFPFFLNGPNKDSPKKIVKDMVSENIIKAKDKEILEEMINELIENPQKYLKKNIDLVNHNNSNIVYNQIKLKII